MARVPPQSARRDRRSTPVDAVLVFDLKPERDDFDRARRRGQGEMMGARVACTRGDRSRVSGRGNDFALPAATAGRHWRRRGRGLRTARPESERGCSCPMALTRLMSARAQSFQSLNPSGAASISTTVGLTIRARSVGRRAARAPVSQRAI